MIFPLDFISHANSSCISLPGPVIVIMSSPKPCLATTTHNRLEIKSMAINNAPERLLFLQPRRLPVSGFKEGLEYRFTQSIIILHVNNNKSSGS